MSTDQTPEQTDATPTEKPKRKRGFQKRQPAQVTDSATQAVELVSKLDAALKRIAELEAASVTGPPAPSVDSAALEITPTSPRPQIDWTEPTQFPGYVKVRATGIPGRYAVRKIVYASHGTEKAYYLPLGKGPTEWPGHASGARPVAIEEYGVNTDVEVAQLLGQHGFTQVDSLAKGEMDHGTGRSSHMTAE